MTPGLVQVEHLQQGYPTGKVGLLGNGREGSTQLAQIITLESLPLNSVWFIGLNIPRAPPSGDTVNYILGSYLLQTRAGQSEAALQRACVLSVVMFPYRAAGKLAQPAGLVPTARAGWRQVKPILGPCSPGEALRPLHV